MGPFDFELRRFREAILPFTSVWRSLEIRTAIVKRQGEFGNVCTSILFSSKAPPSVPIERVVQFPDFEVDGVMLPFDRAEVLLKSMRRDAFPHPVDLRDSAAASDLASVSSRSHWWLRRWVPGMSTVLKDSPAPVYIARATPPEPSPLDVPQGEAGAPPTDIDKDWNFHQLERKEHGSCFDGKTPNSYRCVLESWHGAPLKNLWSPDQWSDLNRRLAANPIPFHGISDVFSKFVGYNCTSDLSTGSTALGIVAPVYCSLESGGEPTQDRVELLVHAPETVRLDDLGLSVVGHGEDGDFRLKLGLRPKSTVETLDSVAYRVEIKTSNQHDLIVKLLLFDQPIDTLDFDLRQVNASNIRFRSYEALEPNKYHLNRVLNVDKEPTTDSDAYEIGVSWVFHIAGFQTAHYGLKRLQFSDSPDFLAFVPNERRGLVVECTLGDSSKPGKLATLQKRAREISIKLKDLQLTPVMVSGAKLVTERERSDALEMGIALLSAEDLRRLLREALDDTPPERIFETLREKAGLT